MIDQGFACHTKIAVLMICRHKTFVAQKKMNFSPIERGAQSIGPKQLVDSLRCRAARKAQAKASGRGGNTRGDNARNPPRQSLRVTLDIDDRRRRHRHITSSAETVSDANCLKKL
jgi:hypothetical protein